MIRKEQKNSERHFVGIYAIFILNFYKNSCIKMQLPRTFFYKMEPLLWNKPLIRNTFTTVQVVFKGSSTGGIGREKSHQNFSVKFVVVANF